MNVSLADYPWEIKPQALQKSLTRTMNGIHFSKSCPSKHTEVIIASPDEYGAFFDLGLVAFPGLELNFPFQINVPGAE